LRPIYRVECREVLNHHHHLDNIDVFAPLFDWRSLSQRPPSVGRPFASLAATDSELHGWPVDPTSGKVKLLLPPRQSRGNSHYGLARSAGRSGSPLAPLALKGAAIPVRFFSCELACNIIRYYPMCVIIWPQWDLLLKETQLSRWRWNFRQFYLSTNVRRAAEFCAAHQKSSNQEPSLRPFSEPGDRCRGSQPRPRRRARACVTRSWIASRRFP
jgi:hypothetical protein